MGHANFWKTFGERGSGPGQMNIPSFIAIGKLGDIYITDTGNFRVQVFDRSHKLRFAFGQAGRNLGDFTRPKGIALDSEQNIYVTDGAFNNFQIFNQEGRLLMFIGGYGDSGLPGTFNVPGDIDIDENDRIYVSDQLGHRVQTFQFLKDED